MNRRARTKTETNRGSASDPYAPPGVKRICEVKILMNIFLIIKQSGCDWSVTPTEELQLHFVEMMMIIIMISA